MDEKPRKRLDEASKIADAAALFDEGPSLNPIPVVTPGMASGGVYDVAPAETVEEARLSPPPIPTAKLKKKASPNTPPPFKRPPRDPAEAVSEVWTRGAEWGQTMKIMLGVGIGFLILFFILFSFMEQYGLAFLTLLAAAATLALLSYPMLITLERPVRMTPERAIKDYLAALSHHFPHHHRMWFLLSDQGKLSTEFASLEGFQKYWKTRVAELKSGHATPFTPLKFKLEDFNSEKSAGKTEVEATYTISVGVRGKADNGPIEIVKVNTTLVKGPDNMWYLDRGTLP